MEKLLKKYKNNLSLSEEEKSLIWDKIAPTLPKTHSKSSLQWGLNWISMLVLFVFIAGGLSFYGISTIQTKQKTEMNAQLEEDQSRSIAEKDVYADGSDTGEILSVNPDINYIDNAEPGEQLTIPINITYTGSKESTSVTIDVIDFDIDRTNCSNTTPLLNRQTANSALTWVKTTNQFNLSQSIPEAFELKVTVPPSTENQTYWFAVTITDEETNLSKTSLIFVTVGEKRSIKCFSTTNIHYKI